MSNDTAQTYNPQAFPPFAVTVDLVILSIRAMQMEVLLVQRKEDPDQGAWALPGGFVGPQQDLLDAAEFKLAEKTGIDIDRSHLEQLGTFGAPDRDPRMRIVSVAFLALVPEPRELDVAQATWHPIARLQNVPLAFDHAVIADQGIERARAKLEYSTLATSLCGDTFTIVELRGIYEAVWGCNLDPANFHRKVLACAGFVEATGESISQGRGRPAQLYRAGAASELHPSIRRNTHG